MAIDGRVRTEDGAILREEVRESWVIRCLPHRAASALFGATPFQIVLSMLSVERGSASALSQDVFGGPERRRANTLIVRPVSVEAVLSEEGKDHRPVLMDSDVAGCVQVGSAEAVQRAQDALDADVQGLLSEREQQQQQQQPPGERFVALWRTLRSATCSLSYSVWLQAWTAVRMAIGECAERTVEYACATELLRRVPVGASTDRGRNATAILTEVAEVAAGHMNERDFGTLCFLFHVTALWPAAIHRCADALASQCWAMMLRAETPPYPRQVAARCFALSSRLPWTERYEQITRALQSIGACAAHVAMGGRTSALPSTPSSPWVSAAHLAEAHGALVTAAETCLLHVDWGAVGPVRLSPDHLGDDMLRVSRVDELAPRSTTEAVSRPALLQQLPRLHRDAMRLLCAVILRFQRAMLPVVGMLLQRASRCGTSGPALYDLLRTAAEVLGAAAAPSIGRELGQVSHQDDTRMQRLVNDPTWLALVQHAYQSGCRSLLTDDDATTRALESRLFRAFVVDPAPGALGAARLAALTAVVVTRSDADSLARLAQLVQLRSSHHTISASAVRCLLELSAHPSGMPAYAYRTVPSGAQPSGQRRAPSPLAAAASEPPTSKRARVPPAISPDGYAEHSPQPSDTAPTAGRSVATPHTPPSSTRHTSRAHDEPSVDTLLAHLTSSPAASNGST